MDKPIIIETKKYEDFRGWLSVPLDKEINASPQTWVLAMKNPRILRGLRRFYRNDQDH